MTRATRSPQQGTRLLLLWGGGDMDEPIAFHQTQDPINGDVAPRLGATSIGMGIAIPIDLRNACRSSGTGAGTQGDGIGQDGDPMGTITGSTLARPAVAFAIRGREGGAQAELGEPDLYNSLRAGDGGSSRQNGVITPTMQVRRLTPRECERLMGWPDDHTAVGDDGKPVSDSHRYRMCGNGVVAHVGEWIGRRIAKASEPVTGLAVADSLALTIIPRPCDSPTVPLGAEEGGS